MAKQVINVGTADLAGDGDALRQAFIKVNSNFTELYDDDAQDITLASFSVGAEGTASGDGAIAYNNTTGVFSYTPAVIPATLLNLGISDGTSGQILSTDGSGNFSFIAQGSGSGFSEIVQDTTPQLGGNLDGNSKNITNLGTINTHTIPAGTGTLALTSDITTQVNSVIDSAPGAMDTLNELAAAMGDDANFSTTITNSIATKFPLAGGTMTGALNMGSNNITTTGKILFSNVYSTEGDLPSASTYHGMFAHVHATGAGYFAHGGNWIKLSNASDGIVADTTPQLGGNLDTLNTSITSSTGNVKFLQQLQLIRGAEEAFVTLTGSTGTVAHDTNLANVFYHTGASANFTANFTNYSNTQEFSKNIAIIVNQGGTGYIPNAVQIGGAAQTIVWQGNSAPTATDNGTDIFSFTILNDGGTYVVLGQMVSFGGV